MLNWLLFSLVTCFWGGSFIAIRFTLAGMPPFAAAGMRILLGTLFLSTLALVQKTPFPESKSLFRKLLLLGVVNFAVPWACLFWGELYVQPAIASILNSTVPFFVLLFSWMLLADEQPVWLHFVGVGLGFFGILFVFAPSVRQFSVDHQNVYGMLAIVGMAVAYGLGTVLTKKVGHLVDIRWNISLQGVGASVALFTLSALTEPHDWIVSLPGQPKVMLSLLYLSFFSTALAWLFYFHLVKSWGALRASAVTYVVPFISVMLDWLYDGKLPTFFQLIGASFIISAIGLIHLARHRRAAAVSKLAA